MWCYDAWELGKAYWLDDEHYNVDVTRRLCEPWKPNRIDRLIWLENRGRKAAKIWRRLLLVLSSTDYCWMVFFLMILCTILVYWAVIVLCTTTFLHFFPFLQFHEAKIFLQKFITIFFLIQKYLVGKNEYVYSLFPRLS